MLVCPQCGRENSTDSRFCSGCGAALAAEPAAEIRKTVTVLFCDLVGSTSLGDRSDPEVLRLTMSRYHTELRAILERHGGTVEKFVGDAAMAVFGIPQVHEDDALRAVRAAAESRDAVTQLELEVRIGVNTGEVVAGTGETLVTGDAVNVAARLEQTAKAGEILLGEQTERLIHDAVRTEPVALLELKGKAEPVPAFRLLELLADVPAFTAPIHAPFVGRENELATLEQALRRAVDERQPQLATIVGPPGIGKSRLARELIQRSQARVLVGRCLSYGEGITYWPLSEIASQLGDLRSLLADDDLAAARIEAALGDGVASSEEIAWGFRKLFEALAQEQPLIVVLDDIHWAEPTLLDLIEYVATFAQEAPLLLLCMARADLFELRPGWTNPKPNATLVTLEPLAGKETETLVDELGEISDETKTRIVEAAEGNPLFIEQLVAMQAESGNGRLEIPPTVQALLAARIDRLEPDERSVIERASIEGRLFHRGSVAELSPEQVRAGVGGHLMTLVRKEFIRPDRAAVPGDDGFRFGHILIRDAAYDSIPKRLRAELHERFAGWLESSLPDAPDEILGYHLEQAYRYRAELGAADAILGERAAEKLASAGRAARTRQDVAAAVNLFGRAAELLPEREGPRCQILLELGTALYAAGELERAQSCLEEATALAREASDAHAESLARIERSFVRLRREPEGASDEARREAEAAITALEGDDQVLARAWRLMGEIHLMHAQGEEHAQAFERALEHARAAGDRALEIEIVTQSAPPIVMGPIPVQEGLRRVEDVLERMGDIPVIQLFALHVLGHLWGRLGRFEEAHEAMSKWREQFRELGQEMMYAMTGGCVGELCAFAQDWEGGERVLRETYEILERMQEKSFRSTVAANLGEALYRLGRLDEAERYSVVSEELGSSDDYITQAVWRSVRAKVLVSRRDLGEAESLAREAVEIAGQTDFLDIRAQISLDLGDILLAADRPDQARESFEAALALYEEKGNIVEAKRASDKLDDLAPAF